MKIVIFSDNVAPYRMSWANEMGKTNDVTFVYFKSKDLERNDAWLVKSSEYCSMLRLPAIVIKNKAFTFEVIKYIKHHSIDVVIFDGYGIPSNILGILYMNLKKRSYYINVDGICSDGKENVLKIIIKKILFSKYSNILCGSKATNAVLQKYGIDPLCITNHPFTSLYKEDIYNDIATKQEKQQFREKYGMVEKHIVISVGRFTYLGGYGKGYDVLIKAAEKMDDSIGWYIVGGQPTEEFANIVRDKKLFNVHFVDFLEKETLKEYYRASDVFVLMTVSDVWGLVVNEAMSCGLPVITTDKCMAGLDLVKDGENGYIVKVGDYEALIEKLSTLLRDEKLICNYSNKSLETIIPYTIENMAKTHISVFGEMKNC